MVLSSRKKRTVNHPSSPTSNRPSLSRDLSGCIPSALPPPGTTRPATTPRLTLVPPEGVQSVPCTALGGRLPPGLRSLLLRGPRGVLSPSTSFSPVLLALRARWWCGTRQDASCYRTVLPSRSEIPRVRGTYAPPLLISAQSAHWTALPILRALEATAPGLRRGREGLRRLGAFHMVPVTNHRVHSRWLPRPLPRQLSVKCPPSLPVFPSCPFHTLLTFPNSLGNH